MVRRVLTFLVSPGVFLDSGMAGGARRSCSPAPLNVLFLLFCVFFLSVTRNQILRIQQL